MTAKTLTISISAEDYEYLKQDDLLSPSKIFQVALNNVRESRKDFEGQVRKLEKINNLLQNRLFVATELLKEHNLIALYDKGREVQQ